jgi:hypothetical protein
MSNPNHDERGRFASGESVGINVQKATGKSEAPFKGKVVSHVGTQVTVRSGNKTMTAHQDFVFKDRSMQLAKFRQSVKLRDKQINEAHAKAAALIKEQGHTGDADLVTVFAKNSPTPSTVPESKAETLPWAKNAKAAAKFAKKFKSKYSGAYTIGDQEI